MIKIYLFIYIHIYIYFLFLRVVIWETLRACYFHSTSLSLTWFLLFTKALRFKRWRLGSPMTFALMVSSLRLSVCFICDKRAWVIYCSLSWQWYIFETSNLSYRIYFIMFPIANENGLYQNETNLIFFSARKFQLWLNSEGEVVTLRPWYDAFYCLTHVWRIISRYLIWTFSKWASIKRQEKL